MMFITQTYTFVKPRWMAAKWIITLTLKQTIKHATNFVFPMLWSYIRYDIVT